MNDDGTRGDLTRIGNLSDERQTEVVESIYKRYRQAWPSEYELCLTCGQPDNCGDCNHEPLTQEQVEELGGWFVPLDKAAEFVHLPGDGNLPPLRKVRPGTDA